MDDDRWLAEEFERHRPQLQAIAYRMLGSAGEAEDAVQEAWLRLHRSGGAGIDNLGGWLTTVVGRVSIDLLRSRRARREQPDDDRWLPEPIVSTGEASDPEHEALLADSVGLALLVVLETLSPAERLAFVLHDMFAVPFTEIAPIVERSPEAARQLASRARRRVRGAAPEPDTDPRRQRELVDAFLAASRAGDFEALLSVLDPDVVFRADAGALTGRIVRRQISSAEEVARYAAAQGPRFARLCHPALVNGQAGLIIRTVRAAIGAVGFTVSNDRITTIELVLDQRKLRSIRREGETGS